LAGGVSAEAVFVDDRFVDDRANGIVVANEAAIICRREYTMGFLITG
jgi:hypothetical protein